MTEDVAGDNAVSGEQAPTPGRHRRRWLSVAVVVIAAVLLAAVAWVWRHPSPVFAGNYGLEMEPRPVGQTLWFALLPPADDAPESVTITGIEPVVARDGAEVQIRYLVCDLDPAFLEAHGVIGLGAEWGERVPDRYCTRTQDVEDAVLELERAPLQEIFVAVTSTRAGRTVIRGHRVSFRAGWQRGTQHLDVDVRLAATGRGQPS